MRISICTVHPASVGRRHRTTHKFHNYEFLKRLDERTWCCLTEIPTKDAQFSSKFHVGFRSIFIVACIPSKQFSVSVRPGYSRKSNLPCIAAQTALIKKKLESPTINVLIIHRTKEVLMILRLKCSSYAFLSVWQSCFIENRSAVINWWRRDIFILRNIVDLH